MGGLRVRVKNRIELELPAALLAKHPTLEPWLRKEEGAWNEVGIPFQARFN
jgi:exopolyphosphatase/guanosine-5'-triphosphate,3'-diphosphate pyrophosphatase